MTVSHPDDPDRVVARVLTRTLGIRPDTVIQHAARLAADLGASADDVLETVIEIEKALGIDIQATTPLERIATVGDLLAAVELARRALRTDRGD